MQLNQVVHPRVWPLIMTVSFMWVWCVALTSWLSRVLLLGSPHPEFDVPIGEFTITRVCPTTAVSCMGENEDITHWLFIPNPAANGTYVSTNATALSLCVLSNGSLLITLPSEGLLEPGNFTVTFIPTDMPETSAELQISYCKYLYAYRLFKQYLYCVKL